MKLRSFIGSRSFYKMVLAMVLPIIIQNSITNFVNLLDNIMVGRLGTEQMSGVAVANQLFFVFNVSIFGVVSGGGIFTAQFFGAGDNDGVRSSFRYKLYLSAGVAAFVCAALLLKGDLLIRLFLNDDSDPQRVQETLKYGLEYMRVMLFGLLPFGIVQCYASTLRETGETKVPMYAGMIAVFVNLLLNYLLIFGNLGLPKLGVQGAALATVISRFVELAVITVYAHRHTARFPFIRKLYSGFGISKDLFFSITKCSIPMIGNEVMWSLGQSFLFQTYSLRGLDVVAALNISSTVYNVCTVAFFSIGASAAILIGQALGAGDIPKAKDYVKKMTGFSVMLSACIAMIVAILSGLFPQLYNTTQAVRELAARAIRIECLAMPLAACANCCYFILRSGGRTGITFLFDSMYTWVICIPIALFLVHLTNAGVMIAFTAVQMCDLLKCFIGAFLLRRGVWIRNIVVKESTT